MRHPATPWTRLLVVATAALGVCLSLSAQTRPATEWRRVGGYAQSLGLAGPAGGPVERVWIDSATSELHVRLLNGSQFKTKDLDSWTVDASEVPAARNESQLGTPQGASVRAARAGSPTIYAFGDQVWRSENEGQSWRDTTGWQGGSLLGSAVWDLAIDPRDELRLFAATATGLWMSADGGLSWSSLNEALPNLPVTRILSAPKSGRGLRITVSAGNQATRALEWVPGDRRSWHPSEDASAIRERGLLAALSAELGQPQRSVAVSGDAIYAGSETGMLSGSLDGGQTWRTFSVAEVGPVEQIWADPADARFAVAVLGTAPSPNGSRRVRVLRTLNGGAGWDDLTADLPDVALHGVTVDRAAGAIYVAADSGIYLTLTDLTAPVPPTSWALVPMASMRGPVRDVRLDDAGYQLYAALDGFGVLATAAPHRPRRPLVVHSADYAVRAASPGALLSVLGAPVRSAEANGSPATILAASPAESQIQIPFGISGERLELKLDSAQGAMRFGLPLQGASPAILVDPDGAPIILDADNGLQIDLMHPVRGGMRLQVLASGLGRVDPDWTPGLPAPLENAPRVVATVRALIDGAPVEVTRATLAPGYIGYYLVEVQLPEMLNTGMSELVIEAAGHASNRVRLHVDR